MFINTRFTSWAAFSIFGISRYCIKTTNLRADNLRAVNSLWTLLLSDTSVVHFIQYLTVQNNIIIIINFSNELTVPEGHPQPGAHTNGQAMILPTSLHVTRHGLHR